MVNKENKVELQKPKKIKKAKDKCNKNKSDINNNY